MVFVNSKKFACEACIKGHRSSTCSHTDRPLFEVKKKGRPVSQCERCRELRQSKKVHSKCNCNPKAQKPPPKPQTGQKPPRFVPIAPALPNGLKDVVRVAPSTSSNSRQTVDTLLNPCSCKNPAWECNCRQFANSCSADGLNTLAQAAQLCCAVASNTVSSKPTRPPSPTYLRKRIKHTHNTPDTHLESASMPPITQIASIAGSGCTCGVECNCPGCVEHRGAEYADSERQGCDPDPCGTCVDNHQGIGLPGSSFSLDPRYTSSRMINQFFARAASLPSPPVNRKMGIGIKLDPGNVMVYPTAAMETKERGVPFGLITIPKLECCGGKCGCPDGDCSCGKSCEGCCTDHDHHESNEPNTLSEAECCLVLQTCILFGEM
ncbi:copper fist DNA binding domain-containing protein [Lentinula aff. lateritia]|uniref:Copper fist DNA binding domain-containing protein n=1 Tax=Lentinula aff. lateritia TaxID=2804960 RepID=A0ACC1U403_9AGAR|nr:copper fist DNA binding domain-containing protein [Lentinula aff. lateritia]